MADNIPLPESVELLLLQIALEKQQPLPEAVARGKLAALGEVASIQLLSEIRETEIIRTLDELIIIKANRHRSSASPRNFASPAPAGVVLPPSVEELIDSIRHEQSQPPLPPLDAIVRRELASLREDEALELLHTIQGSRIKSFNAFVMYMIKKYKIKSPNRSLNFGDLDGVTNSMQDHLRLSPISTSTHPGETTLSPCTNNMQSLEQVLYHATNVNVHTFSPSTNVGKSNGQCLMSSSTISNPSAQTLVPSTNVCWPGGQTCSPVLQALDKLEFKKAFLILSYIGRNKLEEVATVNDIEDLAAPKSMGEFESTIWDRFGSRYCEKKDRLKEVDWESGKRYYYYHCCVYSDGSYYFKGPVLDKTVTHLQKVLGQDNVLVVKFYDLDTSRKKFGPSVSYTDFRKVAEDGVFVGLKRFRFFVFKDGGKEEKKNSGSGAIKSYYVNVDSFARFYENNNMMSTHAQRCIFMHVHNVSTLSAYMARFSLILSKTITLKVDLGDPDVQVEVIDDIPCKDENGLYIYDKDGKLQIHTDGTGFISEELAQRCPRNCLKGTSLNDQFFEKHLEIVQLGNASTSQFIPDILQPPLLTQFRMFYKGLAVKGTVLVNKKLKGKTIQIRPSMIKVERDAGPFRTPTVNSFEIVSTSNRPRKARLSQFLIALLYYGGVQRDFFMNILANEVWASRNVLSDKRVALKVAVGYGDIDDNYTVARMILVGIPLEETYIQFRLPIFRKEELKYLKKGKLPIADSFNVMGTADPTGCLNSDEVCIILETGQIEGTVLVYRHPGVHFGDVHILKATRVKDLEDFVGSSKYGIFFPTKGSRSLADKMAGGDFDGDMFFVSRHPKLLSMFSKSAPWTPTAMYSQSTTVNKKPSEFTAEKLEHELFKLFLTKRFKPCISAGQAANNWLAYMDKLLSHGDDQMVEKHDLEEKLRRLVDIYYEALDAPKKGKEVKVPPDLIPKSYPHFMERPAPSPTYQSKSLLGEIYDKVGELKMEAPVVQVWKLPSFDLEVPLRCITSWEDHYACYRKEMTEALQSGKEFQNNAASNVIQKYKQILYEADEFEKSTRAWTEIRFDALAIYHTVYGYAMQKNDSKYCGFAWKVAGPALMKIFMDEQGVNPMYCNPSVLREIL